MAALKHDLTEDNPLGAFPIHKGSDWSVTLPIQDADGNAVDLTGFTFRMKIRPALGSNEELLELTTANGRITHDDAGGNVTLTIENAVTEAMDWSMAVYDLERVSGSNVRPYMYGDIQALGEATR